MEYMIELPAVPRGAEFLYPKKGMGDMDGLFGNVPSSPGKQGESGEDGKQDPFMGLMNLHSRKSLRELWILGRRGNIPGEATPTTQGSSLKQAVAGTA